MQAQQYKAHYFTLEHRFYGPPPYTPNTNNPQMETDQLDNALSTHQAIQDTLKFMSFAESSILKTTNVRWVVFGCGYTGRIASRLRTDYPNAVVAAVAGSAPLVTQYNDTSFFAHFTKAADATTGNTKCSAAAKSIFGTVDSMLATSNSKVIC